VEVLHDLMPADDFLIHFHQILSLPKERYMKRFLLVGVLLILPLAACGPSAEQIATQTASAWTPTPIPTATPVPTLTPTPLPYDLTVSVVDEAGAAVAGASITFLQSGKEEAVPADATGKYSWTNLPGAGVMLNVSAQGYLPASQTATLERGPSEITVVMKRDPYGMLPSTACAAGEKLLYMNDFQDGTTTLAHYDNGVAPVPLGPAVDEAGNTVLIHDFSSPVGDYSTYLNKNPSGGFYEFGDAAWRFRFMETQETNVNLGWNDARPTEFGGITTGGSAYTVGFNTARHIVIQRSIWDSTGQPVYIIGKPGLENKVLIVEPNLWHYLEISSYQGRLQVWLDGVSVVDVVDDMPLPPGGFSIGKGDSGIMYFDAISVCGLSAPFASIPAPVPAAAP
jgi:hypothetical protein